MSTIVLAAFTISAGWLIVYVSPFLPVLTALLTKLSAPGWLKLGLTGLLAFVTAAVTTAIDSSVDLILEWETVGRALLSFGLAMLSYLAFRQPIIDPIAEKTGGSGLG